MIGVIGIDHHRSDVDERSSFALSHAEGTMLLGDWKACELLSGGVVLSTCNRVEIYYEAEDKEDPSLVERKLIASLLQNLELSPRLSERLYGLRGQDASRHLFRLASGLESIVVGETQILGQLKEAYQIASTSDLCTPVLSRLFHRAFEVAKRIRSHYLLSSNPRSAGSVAVDILLAHQGVELFEQPCLILGAGLMAESIYNRLVALGAKEIRIYNRTRERIQRFAKEHPQAIYYCESELSQALEGISSLFVATSASSPIIYPHHLEGGRCLLIVDLAVPRNVDTSVDTLPNVHLWTIDALGSTQLGLSDSEQREIDNLIEEQVQLFARWLGGTQLRDAIGTLQNALNTLLDQELSKLPNHLSAQEKSLIQHYDEHLRTTIATALVSALRIVSDEGRLARPVEAIERISQHIIDTH